METKRCANCHKLVRGDARVCSRCGHTFALKKVRSLTRDLSKPSIPHASPHLAGHYSGLHPEDQPYQSSQMVVQRPARPDAALLHRPEQEPEHIVLPAFEPDTDPELYQPTLLIDRQAKAMAQPLKRIPLRLREHLSRPGAGAPRFSSVLLTVTCLLFLLASSVLAFVLIGNHPSIATAFFAATPNVVRRGDTFTLSGNGLQAASSLRFSLDANQTLYDGSGKALTAHTNERGAFSLQLLVPASWSVSRHALYVYDPAHGISISTGITVEPPSVAPPALQVSTTSLTFGAKAAGTASSLPLTLLNTGGGTVNWQASSDQSWLSVSPQSGSFSGRASIQVNVNRGSLAPQSYSAHLVLQQQGSDAQPLNVLVTMGVSPAPAALTLTQTTLAFAASTTQDPDAQSLVIQNSGGQPLNWTSSVTTGDGSAWLLLSPAQGHLDPATSETLSVSVSVAALQLAPGSYQGTISFAGGANAQVNVSLTVQAPGNLVLSPPALNMSMLTSQPQTSQTVTLQNSGGQSLDWSTSATTSNGGKWLSVSPASGTLLPAGQVTLTVKVLSPLSPGAYQGTLSFINSTNQSQVRQLTVSCTVTAPPIQMQTGALHFIASKGVNPVSQSLSMTNTSNAALNWMVALNPGAPAFLTVAPLNGKIAPGQQISLVVNADIVNAPIGTLSNSISIVSSDTNVLLADQKVSVDVQVVTQPLQATVAPDNLSFTQSASTQPGTQTLTISNTGTTDVHWSLAQPPTQAQPWLTLSMTNGTLAAGATVQVTVSCTSTTLVANTYTATLQLFNTDISTVTPAQTFPVTLTVS